jgi:hypothetical protein
MVSDLRNRPQVEHFLRNASAEELLEQRKRIPDLLARSPLSAGEAERFAARIDYELRFRLPLAV